MFIEVNSPQADNSCFEAVNRVRDLLVQVEDAERHINYALSLINNDDIREVIPTVVETVEETITSQVHAEEVIARTQPDRVEPSESLSLEALAYLESSPQAKKIHAMNQLMLNEYHFICDEALDDEAIEASREAAEILHALTSEAYDIYERIVNFGVEDDEYDDWDNDDWDDEDESEDWDDESDDEDEDEDDDGWWHEPVSFDDPDEDDEDESEESDPNQPFLW